MAHVEQGARVAAHVPCFVRLVYELGGRRRTSGNGSALEGISHQPKKCPVSVLSTCEFWNGAQDTPSAR